MFPQHSVDDRPIGARWPATPLGARVNGFALDARQLVAISRTPADGCALGAPGSWPLARHGLWPPLGARRPAVICRTCTDGCALGARRPVTISHAPAHHCALRACCSVAPCHCPVDSHLLGAVGPRSSAVLTLTAAHSAPVGSLPFATLHWRLRPRRPSVRGPSQTSHQQSSCWRSSACGPLPRPHQQLRLRSPPTRSHQPRSADGCALWLCPVGARRHRDLHRPHVVCVGLWPPATLPLTTTASKPTVSWPSITPPVSSCPLGSRWPTTIRRACVVRCALGASWSVTSKRCPRQWLNPSRWSARLPI